jgi:alpha-beta hydrolase superfamily lysophospholipase
MLNRLFALLVFTLTSSIGAQNTPWYLGNWTGELEAFGTRLTLTFHVVDSPSIKAFMSVPMQGASRLPAEECSIKGKSIRIALPAYNIQYEAQVHGDSLIGTFTQSGRSFPLDLAKRSEASLPQTPKAPFPYGSREVQFPSLDGRIRFAGTFTYPFQKTKACIVLFSGSGTQDRDERIGEHVPFAVWADTLSRQGYAVLRVDDRGAGLTIGQPSAIQNTRLNDLFNDGLAYIKAIQSQPEIGWNSDSTDLPIYLMGHSQGAAIATHILAQNLPGIKGAIGLSPWGYSGLKVNREQNYASSFLVLKDSGLTNDFMAMHDELIQLAINRSSQTSESEWVDSVEQAWASCSNKKAISKAFKKLGIHDLAAYLSAQYKQIDGFLLDFISFDPQTDVESCPGNLLWVQGSKDVQVQAQKLREIALANSKKIEYVELEGYNHLLQPCKSCTVDEYFQLETTVGPLAIQAVCEWLKKQNP